MTPPEAPELAVKQRQDGLRVSLASQAILLRGFALDRAVELLACISPIEAASPFRHMTTPGGWRMSVALTNCGQFGWITDRTGYRYDAIDHETGKSWPAMPDVFARLAAEAAAEAGFIDFRPDACLVNRYAPGARLSLHQDRNESDFGHPIVSVSLGLPATFLWGGQKRTDKIRRIALHHGDVVIWGGKDRLRFHGVNTLADGEHPLTASYRYNFTFRRAL